jgi:WD40 repeat protein
MQSILSVPLPIDEMSWSPSGHAVMIGCHPTSCGEVEAWEQESAAPAVQFLWSVETGQFEFATKKVDSPVAWSPDGRWFVEVDRDRAIIRSTSTGRAQKVHQIPPGRGFSIVWKQSSKEYAVHDAASESHGYRATVMKVSDWSRKFDEEYSNFISWNPNGTLFAHGVGYGFSICRADTGEVVSLVDGESFEQWSPKGEFAITSSSSGRSSLTGATPHFLWDVRTGSLLKTWDFAVGEVHWHPDGERILVYGQDDDRPECHTVYEVVEAKTGSVVYRHDSLFPSGTRGLHTLGGSGAYWSHDGTKFGTHECWCRWDETTKDAYGSYDDIIKDDRVMIHDLAAKQVTHTFGDSNHLAWSPDDRLFELCSDLEEAHHNQVRDETSAELVLEIRGQSFEEWSPDKSKLANMKEEGSAIEIWDPWSQSLLASIPSPSVVSGQVFLHRHVFWSPDGERVAVKRDDRTIEIWSAG